MNAPGIRKILGIWDLYSRLMDLNFMNFMQPHLLMLFHCFVTANSKSQSLQCSHICHVCCFCSQFHKKCQTSSCPMSPPPQGHGRLAACWSELKGNSFGIALLFLSKTCVSKYICPYAWLYISICLPVIPCRSLGFSHWPEFSLFSQVSSFSLAEILVLVVFLVLLVGGSITSSSVFIFGRRVGTSHLRKFFNAWINDNVF